MKWFSRGASLRLRPERGSELGSVGRRSLERRRPADIGARADDRSVGSGRVDCIDVDAEGGQDIVHVGAVEPVDDGRVGADGGQEYVAGIVGVEVDERLEVVGHDLRKRGIVRVDVDSVLEVDGGHVAAESCLRVGLQRREDIEAGRDDVVDLVMVDRRYVDAEDVDGGVERHADEIVHIVLIDADDDDGRVLAGRGHAECVAGGQDDGRSGQKTKLGRIHGSSSSVG